jgi:hypothetical protein
VKIADIICKSRITRACRGLGLGEGNEKGVALIFTFIVMATLTLSVMGYLSFVRYSTKNAGIQKSDHQAIYLAEAGLHKAIWYLRNTAPDGSTDGSWRTTGYPADPGAGPTDPQEESLADGTYTMWVEASDDNIQITSRGAMNNAERVVRQTFVGPDWTEIIYDEFESNFGNWTDGGADCSRYTGGTYAHQGSDAVDLQDNTSSSVVSTSDLALSGYTLVKVDFWYRAQGMDSNEDFWLQISTNAGGDYTTVQSWVEGTDFSNGTFYEESVIMTGYTLTDQTRIRLRVDASSDSDDVYFDEIRVSASPDEAGSLTAIADSWVEL